MTLEPIAVQVFSKAPKSPVALLRQIEEDEFERSERAHQLAKCNAVPQGPRVVFELSRSFFHGVPKKKIATRDFKLL